jgi:hypothetical protein
MLNSVLYKLIRNSSAATYALLLYWYQFSSGPLESVLFRRVRRVVWLMQGLFIEIRVTQNFLRNFKISSSLS